MRVGWEPRGYAKKGYRKYSLAFVAIVFATDLCALGTISPEIWAATVSAALGIVTAGNVGEHRASKGAADG